MDAASNGLNREELFVAAWSVLHRTREELECARSRKDWGEELRQVERRVLGCESAVRAVRRAMVLERMGVAPQRPSSQGLRSEAFRFETPSPPSDARHPMVGVGGKEVEELSSIGQQELVKFLRGVLDVVETMMMVKEKAGSDRHRRARARMKRGLEIVAQFTPRVTDDVLVQRIQTAVAYYAGMLEVKGT